MIKINNMLQDKNGHLNFLHAFFIAAAFTSSFDIFLVVNLGLNFRISQILLLFPIFIAFQNALNHKIIVPLGMRWLLLWSFFILIAIPNGEFLVRNVGYFAWLLINIATIFSCVQIFKTKEKIYSLMRWYIYSFVFVAAFGIFQFFSPLAGFGNFFLIQQWWIYGLIPRVNGFSYEPSFFSTYLLMGWVICAYFLEVKNTLFPRKKLYLLFFVITVSMILSSSRMGILMMLCWYMQYPFRFLLRLGQGYINKNLAIIVFTIVLLLVCIIVCVLFVLGLDKISFLFGGIGVMGGASHSVNDRTNGLHDTLAVFFDSPIIGVGLGGVAPGIAKLHGVVNPDFETVKMYEGNSIFAEVLAASGIFGFIPFVIFLYFILVKPFVLSKKLIPEQSTILIAMGLALIFELVILQFNQNILRQYLWIHIAFLVTSYSAFSKIRNSS
jgi:hypothetical protein